MKPIRTILFFLLLTAASSFVSKAQDAALSKPVNTVIDNYIALKNALSAGDGNSANAKAKELLASLNNIPEKAMDARQLKLWTAYKEKLRYDSWHISEVSVLPHQREHFVSLSNNLYLVLKGLKLNRSVLYREYCDAKRQYFLSESVTAKDPYMGMTGCSKVKETLPAVK